MQIYFIDNNDYSLCSLCAYLTNALEIEIKEFLSTGQLAFIYQPLHFSYLYSTKFSLLISIVSSSNAYVILLQ